MIFILELSGKIQVTHFAPSAKWCLQVVFWREISAMMLIKGIHSSLYSQPSNLCIAPLAFHYFLFLNACSAYVHATVTLTTATLVP